MDIITDLTTRAVAYITVLQDIGNQDIDTIIIKNDSKKVHSGYTLKKDLVKETTKQQLDTITDIIWTSESTGAEEKKIELFFYFSENLVKWLSDHHVDPQYKTPYQWRNSIRKVLYDEPGARPGLVKALYYMPLQIVVSLMQLPLEPYDQRLCQVWLYEKEEADKPGQVGSNVQTDGILNAVETKKNRDWWQGPVEDIDDNGNSSGKRPRREVAMELLVNDKGLLERLKKAEATLPFETIFGDELDEIAESRNSRFRSPADELKDANRIKDPMKRAQQMQLYGLAFSGGGIRSATFNLGIIQKLAENDVLPRIDYLSTVSGGGYIGTWLASWIQRSGSVKKVADRLNHTRSADPMAEEVRPIRWLRMFSNYLAPDAGIMSADTWTMGITWLRNTIINQVILFLALLTVLSALDIIFYGWSFIYNIKSTHSLTDVSFWVWNAVILLSGGLLAGIGMRRHNENTIPKSKFLRWLYNNVIEILIIWAFVIAFTVSARLITNHQNHLAILQNLKDLIPTGILGFISMVVVALIGRYQDCSPTEKFKAYRLIIISSLAATAIGVLALAYVWKLLCCLKQLANPCFVSHMKVLQCCKPSHWVIQPADVTLVHFGLKLVYVIGVPLILEVIACCVVTRMAIMGQLFPDERREWWGRLGAITHRLSVFWIIIVSAVLLLPYAMQYLVDNVNWIKLLGGWGVIVGAGVKLAYSSTASTDKNPGALSKIVNIFTLIAPYIFMLGFLLLGADAINLLNPICFKLRHLWLNPLPQKFAFLVPCIILTVVLSGVTILLGMRVGVNEFSLHYFYRNRLVRAYLGATRSRVKREKTVNKFTNFDKEDDIKLRKFRTSEQYYGPLPILNTAINSTKNQDLDRQDRKAESFVFTPLYCGFDFSLTRSAATTVDRLYEYGYRPTDAYAYPGGPSIGTAMAISGAAINPNWGYHSSPATAFLLTLFNVRLGWWIGNPRKDTWKTSDPKFGLLYLIDDFIGSSDIDARYVCLSDGGHFDNMGLYELIRRRCSYIILGDGEEDDDSSFEGLANAIRRCRIDFGVEISFGDDDGSDHEENDISNMIPQDPAKSDVVKCTVLKASIKYPDSFEGTLIYIKTRITEGLTVDIRQYNMTHKDFPEQSTADQFFSEDQFESYRKLGYDAIDEAQLKGFDFKSCERQNS